MGPKTKMAKVFRTTYFRRWSAVSSILAAFVSFQIFILSPTYSQTTDQYMNADWMHLNKAPRAVDEWEASKNVIVYASDIDMGKVSYNRGNNGSLTLLADTLRLSDGALIEIQPNFQALNENDPRSGILVVARELVVGENGYLLLWNENGSPLTLIVGRIVYEPLSHPLEQSARYKFLQARSDDHFDEAAKTDRLITLKQADGYYGGKTSFTLERSVEQSGLKGAVEFLLGQRRLINASPPFPSSMYPAPNMANIVVSKDLADAQKYAPANSLSLWTIMALEHLANTIESAGLGGDREEVVTQFQRVPSIVKLGFPISNVHADRYDRVTDRLSGLRSKFLPPLYRGSLTVQPPVGVPILLTRFVEDGSSKNRIAPTEALVVPRKVGARRVVGFVRLDPRNNERVLLAFDVQLTLDPALAALAAIQLARTDQTVTGMFSDWTFNTPDLSGEGIASFTVKPIGNILQISLALDATAGNIALWRLGTGLGLPLTIGYQCNVDAKIKGTLSLPLSLSRRSEPDIRIDGNKVINTGDTAVTIEFVMLGGSPIQIDPITVLPDGKPVSISLPAGIDLSKTPLEVPPQAVTYSGRDPFSLEDFDTSQDGGVVQKVVITNLLAAQNTDLNLALDYVQVTVFFATGEGPQAVEAKAGPYRLTAAGSDGSEVTVPFLRPRSGKYNFRVEGNAFYDKGRSSFQFKSEPTADNAIRINQALLQRR